MLLLSQTGDRYSNIVCTVCLRLLRDHSGNRIRGASLFETHFCNQIKFPTCFISILIVLMFRYTGSFKEAPKHCEHLGQLNAGSPSRFLYDAEMILPHVKRSVLIMC